MRIFVAGFQHETNTFARRPADWPAFQRGEFFPAFAQGRDFLAANRHRGLPIAGFVEAADAAGHEIFQSLWAGASPSGPVTDQAFHALRQRLLSDLALATHGGRLDAVYLDLHGAAVSEGCDSPEVALLSAIRQQIGLDVPLVVSLDSHANVDSRLLSLADYATCYRTYPHTDMVDTGRRAHALLIKRVREGGRPLVSFQRIPFLIPILSQSTLSEPARGIYRLLARLEQDLGADASFATGFPAADVPHCGPTVWAYGSHGVAVVQQLCDAIVAARAGWRVDVLPAEPAVSQAMSLATSDGRPIVIADPQDNPGAGACGSTTGVLRALIAAGAGRAFPDRVAIGLINDPASAEAAAGAGIGARIDVALGASVRSCTGEMTPAPLHAECTVRALRHAPVTLTGPMMTGTSVELGPAACLETDGILVCVCSSSTQVLDRSLFLALGVDPTRMAIVVVKSAVHFRADFQQFAGPVVVAASAGEMCANPAHLPWRNLRDGVSAAC